MNVQPALSEDGIVLSGGVRKRKRASDALSDMAESMADSSKLRSHRYSREASGATAD